MEKKTLDAVIEALETYFEEHGKKTPMEYYYGFFDAMAVVRDLMKRGDVK